MEIIEKKSGEYDSLLAQKIDQQKKDGNYLYFLDVNKSAQHFPEFYYVDEQSKKKSAINWCPNDYLCMNYWQSTISFDRSKGHVEVWTSLKRVGANSIISYASRHANEWIDKIE